MDTQSQSPAEETPPPAGRSHRSTWLIAVAIVALGGLLFSVASLRSNQGTAASGTAGATPVSQALYKSLAQAEATTAQTIAVDIKNYAYSPASLTVSVGDTVTWTNEDTAPHTVTVSDGPVKFASSNLSQGQTFSYTFTEAGTYSYYCAVHPDMKASVTVTGSTTTPTSTTEPTSSEPTTTMSMPSSSSSSSSTTSMSMPSTSTSSGSTACVSKEVLQPIWAHIQSAHLETSPGQQVSDLLNLDQYIKTHTVWLEQVLSPVFNGSADKVVTDTLAPIWAHIQSAHLETSLGQQVSDLLNLNQYILTHTVWLEQVLTPLMTQATC
jgi:plastocyanin